jgi:hypothetical protein
MAAVWIKVAQSGAGRIKVTATHSALGAKTIEIAIH